MTSIISDLVFNNKYNLLDFDVLLNIILSDDIDKFTFSIGNMLVSCYIPVSAITHIYPIPNKLKNFISNDLHIDINNNINEDSTNLYIHIKKISQICDSNQILSLISQILKPIFLNDTDDTLRDTVNITLAQHIYTESRRKVHTKLVKDIITQYADPVFFPAYPDIDLYSIDIYSKTFTNYGLFTEDLPFPHGAFEHHHFKQYYVPHRSYLYIS